LFLQYGGYEVIRAILRKQAIRTLTTLVGKMLGVLAIIPIAVFATH